MKVIKYICVIVLFTIPIYIIANSYYYNKKEIERYKLRNDSLNNILNQNQCRFIDYRDNIKSIYENEGYSITKEYPKVIIKNHEIPLSKLKGNNRIFIRISDFNCWSCIKSISKYINNNKNPDINIIYLLTSQSSKITNALISYAEIRNPIYLLRDSIKLPIEKDCEPYFFCIDNNNNIRKVLMPIKGEYRLIDIYLQTFKNKEL